MMRKYILSLCIMLLAVLGWNSVAFAMLPITEAMIEEMEKLRASGKQSNAYLNHSIIDLVYVGDGSVTAYTYTGEEENLIINEFDTRPNTVYEAGNKITSYVFELTNRYRPETELSVSNVKEDLTVHVYTYGQMKDEAMWAVVYGLPECLGHVAYHQRNDSDNDDEYTSGEWVEKYSPENITTTLASFGVGSTSYTVGEETRVMDIAPEIVDDRVFVPVRYLSYALGVSEEGVKWDEQTQTVSITKEETTIQLTIGNTTALVNGQPVEMDVAPYIKNGRTMLPAKWIAEPLGATVTWDETTQQIKIEISQETGQTQ